MVSTAQHGPSQGPDFKTGAHKLGASHSEKQFFSGSLHFFCIATVQSKTTKRRRIKTARSTRVYFKDFLDSTTLPSIIPSRALKSNIWWQQF